MAEPRIRPKRSSTASSVPTAGQLSIGELAINLADGKIYSKNASGTIVQLATAASSATTATTATYIAGGAGGSIPYQSAANTTAMLANGTSGQLLKSNGGTSAPSWYTITSSDVGLGNVENTALSTWTGSANITTVGTLSALDVSGTTTINGLTYPAVDGTSGQTLVTDGAGTLSWATGSGASAAGSSGDLQYNDGSGGFTASSYFSYGSSAYDALALYSNNASFGVFGIFAASGQTYPLLELRDYTGATVYSYFDATGHLYLNGQTNVRFADADSSNYAAIQAPATISTNYTLTLPTTAGTSGYVMTTNGSGALSWTNATNANTASAIVKRDASGNFSAGTITATLSGNATNVSGTVAVANGGTGQTTANAAFNALAPSQTSNSGKYLTTDGSNTSWGTVSAGTTLPAGSMQMFGGAITQSVSSGTLTTTAPSGWALCDGSAVSRTTYSALFAAIGTTYGVGNGSTTFNLPDCRGRAVIGSGQSSDSNMTNRALGTKYGSEGSTISESMLPTFSMDNNGSTTGNHTHGYTAFNFNTNYPPMVYTGYNTPSTWTWGVAGGTLFSVLHNTAAQTNLNITSSGNHNHTRTNSTPTKVDIVQPSIAVNFIIKI